MSAELPDIALGVTGTLKVRVEDGVYVVDLGHPVIAWTHDHLSKLVWTKTASGIHGTLEALTTTCSDGYEKTYRLNWVVDPWGDLTIECAADWCEEDIRKRMEDPI